MLCQTRKQSSSFFIFATGMLVDFSYHPQTHGWGWVSFHQKEENAWDIILST